MASARLIYRGLGMQRLLLTTVRHHIVDSICRGSRSSLLEELLKRDAKIYVLAGAVRDAIASLCEGRDHGAPRDFDIGVAGIKKEDFNYLLAAFGLMNRHGGFVLREKGLPAWDVWRLEDSIGLRKTGISFSLENVLRSFNLDCNAIALDLKTGMFTDAGAIESIRRMRVGFAESAISHSRTTFAAKALLVQLRFGYSVSLPMERFIKSYLEKDTLLYEAFKAFPTLTALALKGKIKSPQKQAHILSLQRMRTPSREETDSN